MRQPCEVREGPGTLWRDLGRALVIEMPEQADEQQGPKMNVDVHRQARQQLALQVGKRGDEIEISVEPSHCSLLLTGIQEAESRKARDPAPVRSNQQRPDQVLFLRAVFAIVFAIEVQRFLHMIEMVQHQRDRALGIAGFCGGDEQRVFIG